MYTTSDSIAWLPFYSHFLSFFVSLPYHSFLGKPCQEQLYKNDEGWVLPAINYMSKLRMRTSSHSQIFRYSPTQQFDCNHMNDPDQSKNPHRFLPFRRCVNYKLLLWLKLQFWELLIMQQQITTIIMDGLCDIILFIWH